MVVEFLAVEDLVSIYLTVATGDYLGFGLNIADSLCYFFDLFIAEKIGLMIDEVEKEIYELEEREIGSSVIGELIMNKLKDLDAVAYVRFASVYREFKDVNTFVDELKKVLNNS